MFFGGFPQYIPVAQRRARAQKKLSRLLKKNPDMKPVIIEGRNLAYTWWGKAWNRNLEEYADYANRMGRGRSYARHRAVLDLQIQPGCVTALVQGSVSKPYKVSVSIEPVSSFVWERMKRECAGRIDSLRTLLGGKFPEGLRELFMSQGEGLFPSPREIRFSCSCPDWASMCKHVAATLYGVGARLDEDPALFFTLRQVNMGDLVAETLADTTRRLLEPAEQAGGDILESDGLSDLFGIDLETEEGAPEASKEPVPAKPSPETKGASKSGKKKAVDASAPAKKSPASRRASTRAKPPKGKGKAPRKADGRPSPISSPSPSIIPSYLLGEGAETAETEARTSPASQGSPSAIDLVAGIVARSRKGIGIPRLKQRTGLQERQLYNIISRLKKQGRIQAKTRGVYTGVRKK